MAFCHVSFDTALSRFLHSRVGSKTKRINTKTSPGKSQEASICPNARGQEAKEREQAMDFR